MVAPSVIFRVSRMRKKTLVDLKALVNKLFSTRLSKHTAPDRTPRWRWTYSYIKVTVVCHQTPHNSLIPHSHHFIPSRLNYAM